MSASPTKEDTLARETTEERFTELYRAHVDAVRAYAWRRARVADDVVAETFLIAWRRIDQVPDGNRCPGCWRSPATSA